MFPIIKTWHSKAIGESRFGQLKCFQYMGKNTCCHMAIFNGLATKMQDMLARKTGAKFSHCFVPIQVSFSCILALANPIPMAIAARSSSFWSVCAATGTISRRK